MVWQSGVGSAAEQLASTDIVKRSTSTGLNLTLNPRPGALPLAKETDYRNQALMSLANKKSASRAFTDSLLIGAGNMGMAFAYGKLMNMAAKTETAEPSKPDGQSKLTPYREPTRNQD